MYTQGLIKITIPDCPNQETEEPWETEHLHEIRDARESKTHSTEPVAYLPHSCQEWVIGGASEIEQMIADLKHALMEIESKKG